MQKWLESNRKGREERDGRLLKRAAETFYKNILESKKDGVYPWGTLRAITPSWAVYRGLWNWDSAFHAIAVSRWDTALAREQLAFFFKNQRADGCFIDSCEENGHKTDFLSKPPIIYWAYALIDQRDPDDALLAEAYDRLVKNESFWKEKRSEGGLFFYSGDAEKERGQCAKWESGWDTSPRFDGDITEDLWAIDLNCYMVIAYRALQYMAGRLAREEDRQKWKEEESRLSERINRRLWDEQTGVYSDAFRNSAAVRAGITGILTPASFMPLFIGIADDRQAAAMAKLASDPKFFYPLMPSCAYCAAQYTETDYWRGPVWINIAYMAVKGLKNYGFDALAEDYRAHILEMCDREPRGLFEYYDSRTGQGLGAIDYGWTAAFVLEFILNFNAEPISF